MQKEQFLEILKKYQDGKATAEEVEFLRTYYNLFGLEPEVLNSLNPTEKAEIKDRIENRLMDQIAGLAPVNKRTGHRWIAAASILLFLSAGGYFILHRPSKQQPVFLVKQDIAPFSQNALLKTGHGKTITLNSNYQGQLAQYSNTHIGQTTGEQITYSNNETGEKVIYDTLQVPAGGRPYHLKLADGSLIIVNVASALRFPENFRKSNSALELISGEAYFQIVHNASVPLTVKAKGQLIEDIGTEFNVSTYTDEPDSRTTLIAGAVKVNSKSLVPGQQAIITENNLVLAAANIQQTIAWKEGYFRFNGERIQAVMRELARWYNIQVIYEGKITEAGFFVRITRSRNISEVLKVLERTNSVHFKIEGRRLTVYEKK